MLKKATHNSSTAERPRWWDILSWLMIPFARTQTKTIQEQLDNGVRMFDLRIKKSFGEYHSGHGLYTTKRTFEDILSQIHDAADPLSDPIYVSIAYEGKLSSIDEFELFKADILSLKYKYPKIKYGEIVVKYTDDDFKVDWVKVMPPEDGYPCSQSQFKALNGKNWQTFIPIPWLWKKIYNNHVEFNEDYFIFVDFI